MLTLHHSTNIESLTKIVKAVNIARLIVAKDSCQIVSNVYRFSKKKECFDFWMF